MRCVSFCSCDGNKSHKYTQKFGNAQLRNCFLSNFVSKMERGTSKQQHAFYLASILLPDVIRMALKPDDLQQHS